MNRSTRGTLKTLYYSEIIHHLCIGRCNRTVGQNVFRLLSRDLVGTVSYEHKTSRQAIEHNSHWNADRLLKISVHQTPERCCRLDIPASFHHLHQSIFVMHQSGPEHSMCLHSQGQHTVSDDFHSCGRNPVSNITLFELQFVMRNRGFKG